MIFAYFTPKSVNMDILGSYDTQVSEPGPPWQPGPPWPSCPTSCCIAINDFHLEILPYIKLLLDVCTSVANLYDISNKCIKFNILIVQHPDSFMSSVTGSQIYRPIK